jgi:hypothetical protein
MTKWINFSLRRRLSVDKFVAALPEATEQAVRAKLVELQVDPSTFPWHVLAKPVEAPTEAPPAPEPPAPPAPEGPPESTDG